MSKSSKYLVDSAIKEAAKIWETIIAVNPVNKASYDLLSKGMAAKTKEINERTKEDGPFQGFIIKNQDQLGFYENLIVDNKYGVIRNNEESWVSTTGNTDKVVMALTNGQGKYVTADIDILLIASVHEEGEIIFDQEYGYLIDYELQIIKYINATYSNLIGIDTKIITHGPYNRYNKSLKELLKFPIEVFSSDGVVIVNSIKELKEVLLSQRNYQFYLPEHWL